MPLPSLRCQPQASTGPSRARLRRAWLRARRAGGVNPPVALPGASGGVNPPVDVLPGGSHPPLAASERNPIRRKSSGRAAGLWFNSTRLTDLVLVARAERRPELEPTPTHTILVALGIAVRATPPQDR